MSKFPAGYRDTSINNNISYIADALTDSEGDSITMLLTEVLSDISGHLSDLHKDAERIAAALEQRK